ncbi:hypothetical protein BDV11DRAFT_199557 [Aspergillus similis]
MISNTMHPPAGPMRSTARSRRHPPSREPKPSLFMKRTISEDCTKGSDSVRPRKYHCLLKDVERREKPRLDVVRPFSVRVARSAIASDMPKPRKEAGLTREDRQAAKEVKGPEKTLIDKSRNSFGFPMDPELMETRQMRGGMSLTPKQQNKSPVGQQMGQGNLVNMNNAGISPQIQTHQHLPNGQTSPQDRSQQAAQTQRVQAAQKAQMAMSQANMQQPIPLSPAMPMANRPMAALGQMSPAQAAAQVHPSSRQPSTKQLPANVQPMGTQQGIQNRPSISANFPPHIQEQLARMSPEQRNAFYLTQQRRMVVSYPALARQNAVHPNMAMQQGIPQSSQGQQMINGQMVNPQIMRASLDMQQQFALLGGAQQLNQIMPGQQITVQQRQQQLQQQQQLH